MVVIERYIQIARTLSSNRLLFEILTARKVGKPYFFHEAVSFRGRQWDNNLRVQYYTVKGAYDNP